jgi:hypothetical protein
VAASDLTASYVNSLFARMTAISSWPGRVRGIRGALQFHAAAGRPIAADGDKALTRAGSKFSTGRRGAPRFEPMLERIAS